MARLIDADTLRAKLDELGWTVENGFQARIHIDSIIENTPTVETDIEVVAKDAYEHGYADGWKDRFGEPDGRPKGEWIKCGWSIRCSICNYDMPYTVRNFCPNCGADMRKGSTESLDYQRAVEDAEYCERYEPTYNPNDGSM